MPYTFGSRCRRDSVPSAVGISRLKRRRSQTINQDFHGTGGEQIQRNVQSAKGGERMTEQKDARIERLDRQAEEINARMKKLKTVRDEKVREMKKLERKERNHRLIRIGAVVEHELGRPLTDQDVDTFADLLRFLDHDCDNYFLDAMNRPAGGGKKNS